MNFLKTTLIGGIMLLVPIAFCVLMLARVHRVMQRVAAPLADWIPLGAVGGVAKANVLAILALIVLCFLAGLFSRSGLAARFVQWLESGILRLIPGYTFVRGLTGGLSGAESDAQLVPVLARFDDNWQLAFRVESLDDGRIVVFVPGAPDSWRGYLVVMEGERVQPIDRKMAAAVRNLRALGRGSRELLSSVATNRA